MSDLPVAHHRLWQIALAVALVACAVLLAVSGSYMAGYARGHPGAEVGQDAVP